MDTQFPASVMSLGVVGSEKDVIALYFYPRGLSVNVADYKEMLKRVIRPWMCTKEDRTPTNMTPSHKAKMTQEWMS